MYRTLMVSGLFLLSLGQQVCLSKETLLVPNCDSEDVPKLNFGISYHICKKGNDVVLVNYPSGRVTFITRANKRKIEIEDFSDTKVLIINEEKYFVDSEGLLIAK